MDDKKIDGIQKMSKNERERSRKIVLDFIGEDDNRGKKKEKLIKNIDGINMFTKANSQPEPTVTITKKTSKDFVNKIKAMNIDIPVDKKPDMDKADREEVEKRLEQNISEYKAPDIKKEKPITVNDEHKSKTEKPKVLKLKKRKIIKKTRKHKKLKAQKLKNKKRSITKWSHKKSFKKFLKILGFVSLLLSLLFVFLYLVFAIFLLKFNVDNSTSRSIAGVLPVPKIISKEGFINYYDYIDIENGVKDNFFEEDEQLEKILKNKYGEKIVLDNLAKKYNIYNSKKDVFSQKSIISQKILSDQEINNQAYEKLDKIKILILRGDDFEKVGKKYGDKTGKIKDSNYDDFLQLKQVEQKMKNREVSDIIVNGKGYYIIKKESVKEIRYIFVEAQTLDDYLKIKKENMRIWVLAGK